MRIKVDQNLPREVADVLRSAGHDAVTVNDQQMAGAPDDQLAAVVRAERRGLITLDIDFADVRLFPPTLHAGLIVLRLQRQDKPHVLAVVGRLAQLLDGQDLAGQLWIVDETRVRIRP